MGKNCRSLRGRKIRGLNTSRSENNARGYALDHCHHLADIVASRVLVPPGRRLHPHCFGDRCNRGSNKALYGSRSVGLRYRTKTATAAGGSPIASPRIQSVFHAGIRSDNSKWERWYIQENYAARG